MSGDRAAQMATAQAVLQKNVSARYMKIDRLERYFDGTQYDDRPDFWSGGPEEVPLLERAPCIVYPIAKNAIRAHTSMCLGENKWPKITSHPAEDDEGEEADGESDAKPEEGDDDEYSLNEDDSRVLDAYIAAMVKHTRLRSAAIKALTSGMKAKTAVTILCARDGRLSVEATRSKWCTPSFVRGSEFVLESIEIKYPFIREKRNAKGQYDIDVFVYRRVIDGFADTTFKEVKANIDGSDIDEKLWVVDPVLTVEHGLGFCPVVWYPFKAQTDSTEVFDGHAIHEHELDEIDALNMSLSQKHRAAFYAGDPQMVETGVDENHSPTEDGRTVIYRDLAEEGAYMGRPQSNGKTARRKGAGVVWRYPDKDTSVEMLTLPGDALKALEDTCKDQRAKLLEAFSVVFMDPENIKHSAEVSGRALLVLLGRQLSEDDEIRDDFGPGWICRVVDMGLRISATLARMGMKLHIRGFSQVLPILQRFERTEAEETAAGEQEPEGGEESEAPHVDWVSPELDLVWGEYFSPSAADELADVQTTVAAKQAGMITDVIAIEKIASIFNIKSPAIVAEALKAAKEEQQQNDMAAMHELSKIPRPPPTKAFAPPSMPSAE